MKICIPIESNDGIKSTVNAHFGSALNFLVYDEDKRSFEVIANDNAHHSHGMCHPLSQLRTRDIDVVICGGMGIRAIQKLNEGGIKAFRTEDQNVTAEEILDHFRNDELKEITADSACREHNCH